MELVEHIDTLRAEGMLLADSAEATGLDAQVPSCPEWTVRDLVRHLGEVHRWAASHVIDARETMSVGNFATYPEDDAQLLDWFREGHAELLQALEVADPEGAFYGFLPGGAKGTRFWARRQAHETTIHRVDAQNVTGLVSPSTTEFAVDGIDEMLHGFLARRPSRLTSAADPYTFVLVCTDDPQAWQVAVNGDGPTTTDDSGEGGTRVYGTAFDLYLLLWNRRPLAGLEVQGPTEGLEHYRAHAYVRWT
ncbi:hypothetical protein Rhe02_44010 [Rhizocola hellebori]|uniref:Maleylpyruvate isomerase family mycothiol-dependent enzyme n=2 Tax=Rhizocola hellebori TaxID=1392758 RepID=A0A8J3QAB9_9ACTN|nr:hypothetical protein Rhe02_44010 [Rhizocola hellebori]